MKSMRAQKLIFSILIVVIVGPYTVAAGIGVAPDSWWSRPLFLNMPASAVLGILSLLFLVLLVKIIARVIARQEMTIDSEDS